MRLAGVIACRRRSLPPKRVSWRLALIQTGETELLLKEGERTKEEMGNVKL